MGIEIIKPERFATYTEQMERKEKSKAVSKEFAKIRKSMEEKVKSGEYVAVKEPITNGFRIMYRRVGTDARPINSRD